jgi:mannose-1-phosphate guanylyltransferase
LYDCTGTVVQTRNNKLIVASGLENFIVVNEGVVFLIFPKDLEQEIKRLREVVKQKGLDTFL